MKKQVSTLISKFVFCLTFLALISISSLSYAEKGDVKATIKTNLGSIELSLFKSRTPTTVANFIDYANSGFYEGTLFHRVIPNFMIQGGGLDKDMNRKATNKPIKNEANAFIPNLRGTISMARTNMPHSATSQFFINVKDNDSLNKSNFNAGYAVFGKVTKGMDIADKIALVKTKKHGHMRDVPVDPIIIESVTISEPSVPTDK